MIARLVSRIDRAAGQLLRSLAVLALVLIVAALVLNILARSSGLFALAWFDEVVLTLFAWMVFLGAAALWREQSHFAIDLVPVLCRGTPAERPLKLVLALIGLGFALSLTVYGASFVLRTTATTPILGLPQAWSYACIPLAGAIMTIYALRDVFWVALQREFPIDSP